MKQRVPFTLFGERWYCLFVTRSALTDYKTRDKDGEPERNDGDCIVPTVPEAHRRLAAKDRRVRLCKSMDDETILETAIHELVHGACPWLIESWVHALARDIAILLVELGFHR